MSETLEQDIIGRMIEWNMLSSSAASMDYKVHDFIKTNAQIYGIDQALIAASPYIYDTYDVVDYGFYVTGAHTLPPNVGVAGVTYERTLSASFYNGIKTTTGTYVLTGTPLFNIQAGDNNGKTTLGINGGTIVGSEVSATFDGFDLEQLRAGAGLDAEFLSFVVGVEQNFVGHAVGFVDTGKIFSGRDEYITQQAYQSMIQNFPDVQNNIPENLYLALVSSAVQMGGMNVVVAINRNTNLTAIQSGVVVFENGKMTKDGFFLRLDNTFVPILGWSVFVLIFSNLTRRCSK